MGGQPCILLIEDDSDIASLERAILEGEGYAVVQASDGPQGVELALAEQPDLIVLDMLLPGLDGLDVARALRAAPQTAATPILAISALYIEAAHEAAREAGVTDYLDKPFAIEALIAKVAELLRSDRGGG